MARLHGRRRPLAYRVSPDFESDRRATSKRYQQFHSPRPSLPTPMGNNPRARTPGVDINCLGHHHERPHLNLISSRLGIRSWLRLGKTVQVNTSNAEFIRAWLYTI